MYIGRPYSPRPIRSRCHPYSRLGSVFRTVRSSSFFLRDIDRALLRDPAYAYLPPISAFCAGCYSFILDGPGTCSRSRKNKIGMELLFSGAPPCVILFRLAILAMLGVWSSRAV